MITRNILYILYNKILAYGATRVEKNGVRGAEVEAEAKEGAWIGLLGWLASLDGHFHTPGAGLGGQNVLALDRWACAAFQIGFLPRRGPFLGYPADLWWFARVWRGAAAGTAGIALVADYASAFALFFPGEWPKTLAEYARAGAVLRKIALCPTAVAARPDDLHAGVGPGGDLGPDKVTLLPYLESVPWLDPLLNSR